MRECEGAKEESVSRLYRESDGKCSRSHGKTARFRLHGERTMECERVYIERDRERDWISGKRNLIQSESVSVSVVPKIAQCAI
ncbi:hypothetical protein VNO80_26532 [Phaseolus coccineus]|uniref:Uncharacterized protein n=1 Tax=Phaseolus coccineus TaxID=3886 RepID=A0AAN9LF58_PHACN